MFIAQELKKQNICEYLLYMWQTEDLIRAYGCDAERIGKEYVALFTQYTDEQRNKLCQWYADLIEMMRREGVLEKGHLQINANIILLLTDLHNELLKSPKQPFYSAAYYKALPYIVELRNRGEKQDVSEIETCFDAQYGVMLLKLQKKAVSNDTLQALKDMSHLLALLAKYYQDDKDGKLEL